MNDTLTLEERRQVRGSLIAALVAAFTVATVSFAWAEANPKAAEKAYAVSVPPAASAPAGPAISNEMTGCGCAEGCRS